MGLLCLILVAFALHNVCDAFTYRVLVVFPFPARSHDNLGKGVVRHLLAAGHRVVHITPFPTNNSHPNLEQIDVSFNKQIFPEDAINIQKLMYREVDLNDEYLQHSLMLKVTNATFYNKAVINLLDDPQYRFDVVIAEWLFNEVYSGFGAAFRCPYIWTYPYEPNALSMSLIDDATNPAYVPHLISENVTPFTFAQRVEELFKQIASRLRKLYYFSPLEKQVYEEVFGPVLMMKGRKLPPYEIMRYNASLMFGSSHVTLGQAVTLPQNYKDIGGYYIEDKIDPLPKDLQEIMDKAKYGVIYFSMGSNLKSKELPIFIKVGLLKAFARLRQTVLWKFEEDFPKLPRNVHVIKWAPQQSVLAHRNCILFVTHGGLLSTTEAVHFGVPFIGIPVFVDQFNNVDRAVKKGYAKKVHITHDLPDDLRVAIEDMLRHTSYAARAKQLSRIYHDRPVPPGRELVHWVEHVVRTRGAPHLRSPALLVPLYQKFYLDLAALVLAILLLLRALVKKCISVIRNAVSSQTSRRTQKKRN